MVFQFLEGGCQNQHYILGNVISSSSCDQELDCHSGHDAYLKLTNQSRRKEVAYDAQRFIKKADVYFKLAPVCYQVTCKRLEATEVTCNTAIQAVASCQNDLGTTVCYVSFHTDQGVKIQTRTDQIHILFKSTIDLHSWT